MKIAIIWKWWAWKTTISTALIKEISKKRRLLAIDWDSNKNLVDYLGFDENEKILELWDLKKEIFEKAWVASSEYDRKYFPKDWVWIFSTDYDDEILSQVLYKENNIELVQLWEPRECRIWVTGMCPYYETIKVYLSNLVEKKDEIVFLDFAAWSEVAWKWIVASLDNIIIPLEPNSKNLDVARDIYKTLKLIDFKNVYFILNKLRSKEDIEFIKKDFWEEINIIWTIPFSKEIMKMDIRWDIDIENMNSELKDSFDELVKNILKLESNRDLVLDRLKKLDILKWNKKVH